MQLSTRQARIFRLAMLLGPGTPVEAQRIITQLGCSEPTLTRALKELRETYSAEIRYSKATHSYQLVKSGQLDKKKLRQMHNALSSIVETKPDEIVSKVSLDKEKKKAVSLSLRMSVLRKIDQLAMQTDTTRSDIVELLVDSSIAQLAATLHRR
ncbi:tellurium resistance protein TerW [uncultured Cedecea sp.]|uniref:tellurium resistance protein TerW n=1 Tax=uncultured Cedecea sp. TaxID=988762 RepID=UPI00260F596B|nr:tellurium resistance protein TerW [uncultured Cedecea sp.]